MPAKILPFRRPCRTLSPGQRRMRAALHKLGLRQCDLAVLLGVDERTIRRWWNGRGLRAVEALCVLETRAAAGLPQVAESQHTEAAAGAPGRDSKVCAAPGQPAPDKEAA